MSVADIVTGKTVVVFQGRAVVPLLAWMAPGGKALQIVTDRTSRITVPLCLALGGLPGSRWVIAENGTFSDGLTGKVLRWDGEAFTPDPEISAQSPGFLAQPETRPGAQLVLTVEARRAKGEPVGAVAAQLCRALAGTEPTGWGWCEPAGRRWDPQAFDSACRGRPSTAIIVSGREFVARCVIQPAPDGSHRETVTAAVGYPDLADVPVLDLPSMIATVPGVTSTSGQILPGRPDLTIEPRLLGAPTPLRL
ncbi:hypothetical protein GCM10027589_25480 [Actinocorallia lasiicapitis]